MKFTRKFSKLVSVIIFSSLCVSILGLFLVISVNYSPIVISSNSMQPTINIGDVVFTEEIKEYSEVEVGPEGDIIVIANFSIFVENNVPPSLYSHLDENTPIIHRAIERRLINGSFYFVTKGDNNEFADGCIRFLNPPQPDYQEYSLNYTNPVPIPTEYIIGKVVKIVPFIGYFKLYSGFINIYILSIMIFVLIINFVKKNAKNKSIIHISTYK